MSCDRLGKHYKVLLVDHFEETSKATIFSLLLAGVSVTNIEDLEEALNYVEIFGRLENYPDIVLINNLMENRKNLEIIDKLTNLLGARVFIVKHDKLSDSFCRQQRNIISSPHVSKEIKRILCTEAVDAL
jgi:CheY-like chemotaxis protein